METYMKRVGDLFERTELVDLLLRYPAILRFLLRHKDLPRDIHRSDLQTSIIPQLDKLPNPLFIAGRGFFVDPHVFKQKVSNLKGSGAEFVARRQIQTALGVPEFLRGLRGDEIPSGSGKFDGEFPKAEFIAEGQLHLNHRSNTQLPDGITATVDTNAMVIYLHEFYEVKAGLDPKDFNKMTGKVNPVNQMTDTLATLQEHGVWFHDKNRWWPEPFRVVPQKSKNRDGPMGVLIVSDLNTQGPFPLAKGHPVYALDQSTWNRTTNWFESMLRDHIAFRAIYPQI
jgi:hypothetical protein